MINHNDVIKQYQLIMKYKYSIRIYALDEWLQCSDIGQRSPAYCMALVDSNIIMKYGKFKRE